MFATLAPLRSWRDITLGEIFDKLCSILPEVTSGDLSSLAQVFFDNLSTVLASLYAIQDLAKIQPTATTTSDSTYVTDASVNKTVSLSTMNAILFGSVAPGLGLALFFGNTYYTWMAARKRRQFGRDYTALPTGMSTPYAFFMVFNIICKSRHCSHLVPIFSTGYYSCMDSNLFLVQKILSIIKKEAKTMSVAMRHF